MDAKVTSHGSIFLVHPHSEAAIKWLEEHISEDSQRMGEAVVVEHRYIVDLVRGMIHDGLDVK